MINDYKQVQNTSYLDNSINNASFISQVRNEDSRIEPPVQVSPPSIPQNPLPVYSNIEILKRGSRAHASLLHSDLNQRRLTLLAARQQSMAKPRQSVRHPNPQPGDAKKRESTREKQIQQVKKSLRWCDVMAAIIAVSSGILVYNENEVFYKELTDDSGKVTKEHNQSNSVCTSLRVLNMLLTLGLCILIVIHYHFKLKLLKLRRLRLQEDNLRTAGLLPMLIIEFAICMIFCPPYVDYSFSGNVLLGTYEYSIDAIISIITLGKSYLVLRIYGHFSPWTSERASKVCAKYKCQASVSFAVKAELKKRPYLMLGILMGATIIYLGFAIRTFEVSYRPKDGSAPKFDFGYLANAFWLTIITMTTVGFGEGYPSTHLGRAIGVISCIIGMLLVSLMVVSLTVASEFTAEESKAFYILKRIYANDNAKEKAANVIKTIFRLRRALKQRAPKKIVEKFVMVTKLKKQISIFKNDYRIANAQNLPIDEMLKNLQEKLETDINDIKREVMVIPELDTRCNKLKERQERISTRLDEVIKIQSSIADYMIKLNNVKKQK